MIRPAVLIATVAVPFFASSANAGLSISAVHVGPAVIAECSISVPDAVYVTVTCSVVPGISSGSGGTTSARANAVGVSPGQACATGTAMRITPFGPVTTTYGPTCITV